jgi:hypothetical protein
MSELSRIRPGTVAVWLVVGVKAKTREEWDAGVAKIWDEQLAELKSNRGFIGAVALWNNDEPGHGSVLGLWDGLENRLAYEARSTKARQIWAVLFDEAPVRTRYIVSQASIG